MFVWEKNAAYAAKRDLVVAKESCKQYERDLHAVEQRPSAGACLSERASVYM